MSRSLVALIATTSLSFAAPASALSIQLGFPTLTYPSQPSPDVTQSCTDITAITADTCTEVAK